MRHSAIGGALSPLLVLLPILVAPMPLAAQSRAAGVALSPDSVRAGLALRPSYVRDPVRVLIVGTWHFANPGRDMVNPESDDVRTPRRQAELSHLLDDLARFEPTHVAVERTPAADSALQARYRELLAGAEPGRSETEQIGMRLAMRLGHERVHPVDYSRDLPMNEVFGRAAETNPEIAARMQPVMAYIGGMLNAQIRDRTISEALLLLNDPVLGDIGHGLYLDLAPVGAGDDYIGAGMVSAWYERNLHIFTNIARLARPGDRVLVVIGSGHEPLLRHFVTMTPGFESVALADYLLGDAGAEGSR